MCFPNAIESVLLSSPRTCHLKTQAKYIHPFATACIRKSIHPLLLLPCQRKLTRRAYQARLLSQMRQRQTGMQGPALGGAPCRAGHQAPWGCSLRGRVGALCWPWLLKCPSPSERCWVSAGPECQPHGVSPSSVSPVLPLSRSASAADSISHTAGSTLTVPCCEESGAFCGQLVSPRRMERRWLERVSPNLSLLDWPVGRRAGAQDSRVQTVAVPPQEPRGRAAPTFLPLMDMEHTLTWYEGWFLFPPSPPLFFSLL